PPHGRGLHRRARARHASDRGPRARDRPARHAADRPAIDPRGHLLPPPPGRRVTRGSAIRPLHVAFLWHMHQPLYRDAASGQYLLPWVRLHAVKDYLHMAEVLGQYPAVKATFNFVPSLVEQIEEYAAGTARDRWAELSLKSDLDDEEKRFLLTSFFSISWERFIRRYPRYWQILQLRNQLDGAVELVSDQYWRDLAAWFNLAWIEPGTLEREPELRALVERDRDFSRADVVTILEW